jgi:16S rRNA (uracil1498-N3)-methyltransferase
MQLFYNPNIDEQTESFYFDKEESKHIIKVLRKKTVIFFFVTNGAGLVFETEITLASDNKCTVKIPLKKELLLNTTFIWRLHNNE